MKCFPIILEDHRGFPDSAQDSLSRGCGLHSSQWSPGGAAARTRHPEVRIWHSTLILTCCRGRPVCELRYHWDSVPCKFPSAHSLEPTAKVFYAPRVTCLNDRFDSLLMSFADLAMRPLDLR
jgi:hypothetical protein